MQRISNINTSQCIRLFLLLALGVLIVIGLVATIFFIERNWPGSTGFGRMVERIPSSDGEVVEFRPRKTLWDLLDLLIVPAILAGGAYWFQRAGKQRELVRQEQQKQESMLQGYLDKITELLIKEPSSDPRSQGLKRLMVRARTLTTLHNLDNMRKSIMLTFLYDSEMITGEKPSVDLSKLDFSYTSLKKEGLCGANLSRVTLCGADLRGADLSDANLSHADLKGANLTGAILHRAMLQSAKLTKAQLSEANFNTSELTIQERAQLPHRKAVMKTVEYIASHLGRVPKIFEKFEEDFINIERKSMECEVQRLQKQLADADETLKVWIEEGKDLRTERFLQKLDSGELSEFIAKSKEYIEKLERKRSEEYEQMKQERKDLQQQLEKAEQDLEKYVHADLRKAQFDGANLQMADLRGANCREANFQNADLRHAWLMNANFSGADLKGADLRGAILSGAGISEEQLASVKSFKGAWQDGKQM